MKEHDLLFTDERKRRLSSKLPVWRLAKSNVAVRQARTFTVVFQGQAHDIVKRNSGILLDINVRKGCLPPQCDSPVRVIEVYRSHHGEIGSSDHKPHPDNGKKGVICRWALSCKTGGYVSTPCFLSAARAQIAG